MKEINTIEIIKPGLYTTIQDQGRPNHKHEGIPQGGYMHQAYAQIANWLVGNPLDNPLLELTIAGPTIRFKNSCQIALSGQFNQVKLNYNSVPIWETIDIQKDDLLQIGSLRDARCYLAISGQWNVDRWLGSCSPINGFFPTNFINTKNTKIQIWKTKRVKARTFNWLNDLNNTIRIIAGPEWGMFKIKQRDFLLQNTYGIAESANRHAYRLAAPKSDLSHSAGIISSGVMPGTIQITPDGEPIILMRDAQTTGGYRRIAKVIRTDLDNLSSLKPRSQIKFDLIDVKTAIEINRQNDLKILDQLR